MSFVFFLFSAKESFACSEAFENESADSRRPSDIQSVSHFVRVSIDGVVADVDRHLLTTNMLPNFGSIEFGSAHLMDLTALRSSTTILGSEIEHEIMQVVNDEHATIYQRLVGIWILHEWAIDSALSKFVTENIRTFYSQKFADYTRLSLGIENIDIPASKVKASWNKKGFVWDFQFLFAELIYLVAAANQGSDEAFGDFLNDWNHLFHDVVWSESSRFNGGMVQEELLDIYVFILSRFRCKAKDEWLQSYLLQRLDEIETTKNYSVGQHHYLESVRVVLDVFDVNDEPQDLAFFYPFIDSSLNVLDAIAESTRLNHQRIATEKDDPPTSFRKTRDQALYSRLIALGDVLVFHGMVQSPDIVPKSAQIIDKMVRRTAEASPIDFIENEWDVVMMAVLAIRKDLFTQKGVDALNSALNLALELAIAKSAFLEVDSELFAKASQNYIEVVERLVETGIFLRADVSSLCLRIVKMAADSNVRDDEGLQTLRKKLGDLR